MISLFGTVFSYQFLNQFHGVLIGNNFSRIEYPLLPVAILLFGLFFTSEVIYNILQTLILFNRL